MKTTHQLLAVAAALGFGQSAWGAAITVPNALSDTEGTYQNRYPFGLGNPMYSMRYQQVYAASEFGSLTAGGELITEIRFRPDPFFGVAGPFSATCPDIQINLSTTRAAPDGLSVTFAGNVGTDDTVVFARGPLSLSSAFTGPAAGPKAFDIVIPLTTPFLYDPADGNLLLDVRNFGGGVNTLFDAQDVLGDAVSRQYVGEVANLDNVNQPTATTGLPSAGLVTQFITVVPEPTVISGLMVAGVFLLTRRRMI